MRFFSVRLRHMLNPAGNEALRHFKLYMFDVDGVLLKTHMTAAHALIATALEMPDVEPPSLSKAEQSARMVLGKGLSAGPAIEELYPQESQDEGWHAAATKIFKRAYKDFDTEHTVLFPGAREALDQLASHDKRLVAVSKKEHAQLEATLARPNIDIADYFEHLFGDKPGESHKPEPAIFENEIWPAYRDVELNDIVMIGDSLITDGVFAQNCSVPYAFTPQGYGQLGDADCPIDFIIRDMHELAACFSDMHSFNP